MMHHIQRAVIDVLAGKNSARYADLKPSTMDGNTFTYHLKQLVREKYVIKNEDGTYSLTKKGQSYLIRRYEDASESAHTIFLVVIRHGDKLLLRRRRVQPALGKVGFVHGEPIANQQIEETVANRVRLKTGIELVDITVRGSGLIRIRKNNDIESFSHAVVIAADALSIDLGVSKDETGENFWIDVSELKSVKDLIPSCVDILQLLDTQETIWFDKTY